MEGVAAVANPSEYLRCFRIKTANVTFLRHAAPFRSRPTRASRYCRLTYVLLQEASIRTLSLTRMILSPLRYLRIGRTKTGLRPSANDAFRCIRRRRQKES